ncbi:hypothetical protein STEG23_015762, partial [Scotinomys teguina]
MIDVPDCESLRSSEGLDPVGTGFIDSFELSDSVCVDSTLCPLTVRMCGQYTVSSHSPYVWTVHCVLSQSTCVDSTLCPLTVRMCGQCTVSSHSLFTLIIYIN